MLKPDNDDPLKNRRLLAVIAVLNGVFIYPLIVAVFSRFLHISDELCGKLLTYMGISILPPIIGYLYAAHTKDKHNVS